jgi:hypothetical protein
LESVLAGAMVMAAYSCDWTIAVLVICRVMAGGGDGGAMDSKFHVIPMLVFVFGLFHINLSVKIVIFGLIWPQFRLP